MSRKNIVLIPESILQLQRQLDQFCNTRPRRTKLPESLSQAAVVLARQHGVYAVAHPLRLDYMGLKAWRIFWQAAGRKLAKPAGWAPVAPAFPHQRLFGILLPARMLRMGFPTNSTAALDLVQLPPLMQRTSGRPEIVVALIDGPVALSHPELSGPNIREISAGAGVCGRSSSVACRHGTFVAGILAAKRGSPAPAICPNCTLLVRPIFPETTPNKGAVPSASPEELAIAIVETINAGARVVNLSAAFAQPSPKGDRSLEQALNYAAQRNALVVAAAGNQGSIGSSAITRHPWVLPVSACDRLGAPMPESNLGHSISKRGVASPGEDVTSLGTEGEPHTLAGTSAAAPFATGTIALLWSEFPFASAAEIKAAIIRPNATRPKTIVPPVLNAWGAYEIIASAFARR
jgi:subtilisin family serine protease